MTDGYPVSVIPNLDSLPEKTVSMSVSRVMPLPYDVAIASKIASLTLLMFSQINGSQELSALPNQFLLNGNMSQNPALCNGSNHMASKRQCESVFTPPPNFFFSF